ncbi:MAG: prepilin-type N-terminal cleavage/methylation domain-containing protein [candidate division WOR-3 bacterium]
MEINNFKSKGFTLVEILVAIVILGLGVLAVSQMTILGLRTSRVINTQMYARDVLNRTYEFLQGLPTTDTTYLKWRSSVNLDDTIPGSCDYNVNETTRGGRFRVVWNIDDSIPDNRFKTVRIHVIPRQTQVRKVLRAELIKRY